MTIGASYKNGKWDKNSVPIIGDNVLIGAGAVILGAVRIGDNVRIGANAVVLTDVPNGCIAVGVPAQIKKQKLDDVK